MIQQLINQVYLILNEILMLPFKLLTEIVNTMTTIWYIVFPLPEPTEGENEGGEEEMSVMDNPYPDPVEVHGFQHHQQQKEGGEQ